MDRPGDDPDLGPAGRRGARAVRPDEAGAALPDDLDGRDHVERRDPLCDAEDRGDPGRRGLHHGIWRAGRRYEDQGRVRAGLADGVRDRVEDGNGPVEGALAALAGRDAGDDVRAVLPGGLGVEPAFAAGDALYDQAGVASDEDAHARASAPAPAARDAWTALAAASSSEAAVSKRASSSSRAASAAFVPTIRTTIGTSRVC